MRADPGRGAGIIGPVGPAARAGPRLEGGPCPRRLGAAFLAALLLAEREAQRILVQADLYDSTWQRHSWGENVLSNIERRKLKVDRHVPVHGAIEPFSQMVETIKAKPGGAPATN